MIRCVIVEDEEMAIDRLRREIDKRPGWEVVATCQEYNEAERTLFSVEPDVCFMDISIIAGSGMALAKKLSQFLSTKWIFSTAYDEYAVDAFDIDALGYLLKPYKNSKLLSLFKKVESELADSNHSEPAHSSLLAVKSIGEVCLVDCQDVMWIKGASNYVELHTENKVHLYRSTFSDIEQRLPANKFVRVHRSSMVNLDYVTKIGSELGRYSLVIMKNGDDVRMSNAHKSELFRLLNIE
ncbi:DNA-binding response regulator [Alteromonas sediminis]|uniref:DNA-binding response regulator n=1 Tax=Alteromonas sediminis TaxID=2259342 RepID=A0A3N5Z8N7_9ALTE|nr:LytTR family DNA-binding domain-containing protein [Alteromonas sediminis]RPJ65428.1 DNA-binding response regulator [Alteromonas sediminis]